MLFLIFISAYFLLMIVGSLSITGWYAITRGRIEYNADGTPYRTGKIFKGWHFFWTEHKRLPRKLTSKRLVDLYVKMKDDGVAIHSFDCAFQEYLTFKNLSMVDLCYLQSKYDIVLLPIAEDNYKVIVYEKVFRFSELVRDPISECIWCMSSVYGSLIWWVAYFLGMHHMFAWSDYPAIASILLWISFCIGCTGLNGFFKDKFKI